MIVTPKEANEKWCAHEHAPGVANRCIGIHCMQWRWAPDGERGYCGLAGVPTRWAGGDGNE